MFESHTLDTIGEKCSQEEWFPLMSKIMREQNKEEDTLYKLFKKYCQEFDGETFFFLDNLAEFIRHHQHETMSDSEVDRLLRMHLEQEKLHSRDPNLALCLDYVRIQFL